MAQNQPFTYIRISSYSHSEIALAGCGDALVSPESSELFYEIVKSCKQMSIWNKQRIFWLLLAKKGALAGSSLIWDLAMQRYANRQIVLFWLLFTKQCALAGTSFIVGIGDAEKMHVGKLDFIRGNAYVGLAQFREFYAWANCVDASCY
jgi:hypothetical protein